MISAVQLPKEAPPQDKYLFKDTVGSSHSWAAMRLSSLYVVGKNVLDIGAGGGGMGKVLRNLGNSSLTAVEPDDRAREKLSGVYTHSYSSIEELKKSSTPHSKYDVILILDVLEHLATPFPYLQQTQELLADGGVIIISIPNIAHWSVRFGLLFGRFEYASRGLLDRTHLQFFTRKRFKKLLTEAELCKVKEISSSIEPFELLLPAAIGESKAYQMLAKVRLFFANLCPGLMAYQHLGILQKK